jgi:hypothetical protein
MTRSQILVAGVLGALAIATPASAETKSWAAIKNKLPAETYVVVGIDVKAIRAAPSFGSIMSAVWSLPDMSEPKQIVDLVKSSCGIDVVTAISDVSIAVHKRAKDVVVAIGVEGVDEAKLMDCTGKIAGAKAGTAMKLTAKAAGPLREYTINKSSDRFYVAWPAKDVLVLTDDAEKPASFDAYNAGKAAGGDLGTFIGKAGGVASPLVWAAVIDPKHKDGFKGGYAALTLAKGTFTVTGRASAIDAAAHKKMLAEAQADLKKGADTAPAPELKKLVQAIKLGAAGTDITLDASLAESELPKILPVFLKAI